MVQSNRWPRRRRTRAGREVHDPARKFLNSTMIIALNSCCLSAMADALRVAS